MACFEWALMVLNVSTRKNEGDWRKPTAPRMPFPGALWRCHAMKAWLSDLSELDLLEIDGLHVGTMS